MLSEDALVRALERVGLRAPVRFEEVTASTQATALELAAAGTPEWTLVAAGRHWSPPGTRPKGEGASGARGWTNRAAR